GQVDDPEAGDLVALLDGPGDLHRAAVPGGDQPPQDGAPAHVELRAVPIRPVGLGRLGSFAVGRVAVHGRVQAGCGATVIGVRVAENDPLYATEAGGG